MLSKLYLGILAVSVALMSFFTYYSWSWLQSIGSPAAAVEGYEYHDAIGWPVLWISAAVLLTLSNVVLWLSRNSWALWTTLIYFGVFILLRYFWLDQILFQFKKANGLWNGSFSVSPIFAVLLVVFAAVLIFFDQFAVVRLHARMYPPVATSEVDKEPDAVAGSE